jgi:hypothetical protein
MSEQFRKRLASSCATLSNGVKSCALLAALSLSLVSAASGQAASTAPREPVTKPVEKPTAAEHEAWRKTVLKTPRPANDKCYSAKYPDKGWTEVPCSKPPHKAYPPRGRIRALDVGNGPDFSAIPATGTIRETEGSFDTSSNITSECAVQCTIGTSSITCPANPSCTGSSATNSYSLQLNTKNFFGASACSGSPNGTTSPNGCSGFEQFVYESGGTGFIQYWLEKWGPPAGSSGYKACPAPHGTNCAPGGSVETTGWCEYPLYGETYCVVNAVNGTQPITEPITKLADFHVNAYTAGTAGMTTDSLAVSVTGGQANTAPGNNYFSDLGSKWTEAEFNVFGDGGGDQAVFNNNSSLTVRVGELSNTTLGPTCDEESFTGESNNFTLNDIVPTALKGSVPALVFTEVNPAPAGAPASCADALSLGDTHVHPFNGKTEYDFQAFGDFVLAQVGSDFLVHTRQTAGPQGYPGTATNTAVAVMMGRTRVAVYLQPARLVIDGKTNNLADGKTVSPAAGILVTRRGMEYRIADENGNRVTADLVKNGSEPLWMNVTVGLGRSPDKAVRGLLGNPRDKADEIFTAKGEVLKVPVNVKDLYGKYADSWRVDRAKSLFVELPPAPVGAPAKPLTAAHLSPAAKAHAITVCKAAGITNVALLDDCILDTTVLKDDDAVKVFTRIAPPRLVIKPVRLEEVKPEEVK